MKHVTGEGQEEGQHDLYCISALIIKQGQGRVGIWRYANQMFPTSQCSVGCARLYVHVSAHRCPCTCRGRRTTLDAIPLDRSTCLELTKYARLALATHLLTPATPGSLACIWLLLTWVLGAELGSSSFQSTMKGNQSRNLEAGSETRRNDAYWFVLHGLISLLFCITQDLQRDNTAP